MVDVYLSLTVFVGILFSQFGILWVEPLAGLIIGIVIAKVGIGLTKDTVLVLMDACLKPNLISQMKATAEAVQGIEGVHSVKMRRSGPYIFGEMHVEVKERMPVEKAHEISHEIERRIKGGIKQIDSVTIHTEPAEMERYRVAVPVDEDRGMDSTINPHLGGAPYFLFIDLDRGQIKNLHVGKNLGADLERRRGIAAAKFLIEHKADVLLTKEIGEGPFHVVRDSYLKTYRIHGRLDIRGVLGALQRNELEAITSPKSETHD